MFRYQFKLPNRIIFLDKVSDGFDDWHRKSLNMRMIMMMFSIVTLPSFAFLNMLGISEVKFQARASQWVWLKSVWCSLIHVPGFANPHWLNGTMHHRCLECTNPDVHWPAPIGGAVYLCCWVVHKKIVLISCITPRHSYDMWSTTAIQNEYKPLSCIYMYIQYDVLWFPGDVWNQYTHGYDYCP